MRRGTSTNFIRLIVGDVALGAATTRGRVIMVAESAIEKRSEAMSIGQGFVTSARSCAGAASCA
jgi:hypothetical protein